MIKYFWVAAFAVFVGLFGMVNSANAADEIYTSTFSNKAISGYDTVSYFQGDGVPVKGSDEFQTEWKGADWYFSSQENLDAFKAEPTKYAPQYGGHCAFATAHGQLAKGDPNVYLVENGKLYFNLNKNIFKQWFPRRAELIPVADKNYPELIK